MKRGDFWFMVGSGLLIMVLAAAASGGFDATAPGSALASSHNLPDITAAPLSFDGEVIRYRVSNLGATRVRNFVEVEYRWVDQNNNPVTEACRGAFGLPGLPTATTDTWSNPGGTQIISLEPWHLNGRCPFDNAPSSARRLRVKLDARNATRESNENNNIIYFDRPLADLVLEPIDLDLEDGQLRFRARNRGTAHVNNATELEIRWVDANNQPVTQPCKNSFNQLPILPTSTTDTWDEPNGSQIITVEDWHYNNSCPFGVLLGSWRRIRIVVDPNRHVAESNEDNNTIYFERPFPDLSISNASFPSRTRLTFTIQQNEIVRRSDIMVTFKWQDRSGNRVGPALGLELDRPARNGERSVTIDSNDHSRLRDFLAAPPATAPFLLITLDPGDEINELTEGNNARQVIRPLPDIAIENLRWNGASAVFTVRNRTDITVVPTYQSKIRYEWHNGAGALVGSFFDVSLPALAARANGSMNYGPYAAGSLVANWLAAPPSGATTLWVTVDPLETFAETNRSNNRAILGRR